MFRDLAKKYPGWTVDDIGRLTSEQADMMIGDCETESSSPDMIPFDTMEEAFEYQAKRRQANG